MNDIIHRLIFNLFALLFASASIITSTTSPTVATIPILGSAEYAEIDYYPVKNDSLYPSNDLILPVDTSKMDSTTTISSPDELKAILGTDYAVLMKVASCEGVNQFNSDGSVVRGIVNHHDVGLWQINEDYHLENAKKMGIDIYTLRGNAEYAKYLYEKRGLSDWIASKPCWSKL